MNSSLIGKIEKARTYAGEPSRFTISNLTATVHGDNSDHEVTINQGQWSCNCDYFSSHSVCSHTMALERLLQGMVPAQPVPAAT
jgi:hypothetical protein